MKVSLLEKENFEQRGQLNDKLLIVKQLKTNLKSNPFNTDASTTRNRITQLAQTHDNINSNKDNNSINKSNCKNKNNDYNNKNSKIRNTKTNTNSTSEKVYKTYEGQVDQNDLQRKKSNELYPLHPKK